MITDTVVILTIKRSFFGILAIVTLLILASCGNSRQGSEIQSPTEPIVQATEAPVEPAEAQTELPIESSTQPTTETIVSSVETVEATVEMPAETSPDLSQALAPSTQLNLPPDLPDVKLPLANVDRLRRIAKDNNLVYAPLARQNTMIYTLPIADGGPVFFLTPPECPLGFSTKELAGDPAKYADRVLGGLSVVRQVNEDLPALPPGDYVITLSPDRSEVIFTGEETSFRRDAVVRAFRTQRLPRPIAVITARQLCVGWDVTQICALVDTPLPPHLQEQLREAVRNSPPATENHFDFDLSFPEITGVTARSECDCALNPAECADPPSEGPLPISQACRANMFIAPAKTGGFPVPPEWEVPIGVTVEGINLANTSEAINGIAFSGNEPAILPPNNYLVYHIETNERERFDEEIEGILVTRSLLFNPSSSFVVPYLSGVIVIGTPVLGTGPSNEEEAGIAVFRRGRCAWWQCARWWRRR